jgi:hypothetical protein
MSDPGPRQEVEKAKLSGNRRGVGWVHSTGETLEQSREERWRRGRREGTQSEEEVDAEARPGHSAGFGVSQEAPIRGSNLNGPPKPRTSITLTSDKSPVRASRTPGSAGEVPGNRHLYPTSCPWTDASAARQSHSGSWGSPRTGGQSWPPCPTSRQRQKFATGPTRSRRSAE